MTTTVDSTMLVPGDHLRPFDFGGRTRSYLVHVPVKRDPSRPTPVVLAFHGGRTNAKTMVRFSGLNETSDREGFLAVYPNGTGHDPNRLTWNAGSCCGEAMRENVDDVGFVRALLDDLDEVADIDASRVFAAGISNGGMFAYRLASELSDRIAAIASVAGPMAADGCRPTRPVSVLHFHGTADEFTPYQGGRGKKSYSQSEFHSVEFSVRNWIEADGCPMSGNETRLPREHNDPTSVNCTIWGPGEQGSEVILYTIHGGGHTWPGRVPPTEFLGLATNSIAANDVMWNFFVRHPATK